MGIGFVMLVWGVVFTIVSAPIAAGIGIWSWINQKRAGQRPRLVRAGQAAALPLVLLSFATLAFVVHAGWSLARGVDPGIGDTWMVPLQNHYSFVMIDTTGEGHLSKASGTNVRGVRRIAQVADSIIGESDSEGAFVLDTSTDKLTRYPDLTAAAARFATPPQLQGPGEFYAQQVSHFPDMAIALLALGGAVLICRFWYRRFIRVGASVSEPAGGSQVTSP